MKPTTTVADFIRRGREAGHDALGIAHDPEAIVAMAAVHRETFLRDRSERSLRRWRELVAEVAASHDGDKAIGRWLGVEYIRLGRAFKAAAVNDPTLLSDAARWVVVLGSGERDEIMSRFDLDLMAPLKAAGAVSRG
ncbi:MAG TPA: hypothetical protein VGD37_09720 [Kofleriaceae bacterium]|jgi:hypothetical protein